MLPDILLGTPFPQVRTSQMLAVCLALPYLASAAATANVAARAAQPAGVERASSHLAPA